MADSGNGVCCESISGMTTFLLPPFFFFLLDSIKQKFPHFYSPMTKEIATIAKADREAVGHLHIVVECWKTTNKSKEIGKKKTEMPRVELTCDWQSATVRLSAGTRLHREKEGEMTTRKKKDKYLVERICQKLFLFRNWTYLRSSRRPLGTNAGEHGRLDESKVATFH